MSERKPRIAIMSYSMDNRDAKGTALYTRKLVEHMVADARFDVYLVHYDRVDDPLYARTHEILMPELKLPFATRFVRQLFFFWKYRRQPFDIIHWCQPRLYPLFWLAPARHLIVTAHGAGDITAGGAFPFSRRVFNFNLIHFNKYISAIIADSIFGKEEVVEWYRSDPGRTHAIYLGGAEDYEPLDPQEARLQVANKYGIRGDYILGVSRHVTHKNIPRLVRAYGLLQSKHKSLPYLVVVGSPNHAYDDAAAAKDQLPRPNDVVWIRFVKQEDLNAFYSGATMFVFPSLNEGFGLPILEAYASGTPVITSTVTSMPEIAGDAALLVNPEDINDIAASMEQLLTNEPLRQELVRKGFERAKTFTWNNMAERTANLYLSTLKQ